MVHHFEVAVLHVLASGDGDQEVVQDGHEEVHDNDNHCQQVEDEEKPGALPVEIHHPVETELAEHCLDLRQASTQRGNNAKQCQQFLPRDVMLVRHMLWSCVCLFVCHSVRPSQARIVPVKRRIIKNNAT